MTEPTPPIEQTTPSEKPAGQTQPQPQTTTSTERNLPRVTIQYCTQCKWMLRAAYFAQELLSTFSTDLGEVSLIPATGGLFRVTMYHVSNGIVDGHVGGKVLWDRKENGGFPEVKVLKSLVRNVIDPSRDLGHTDRALKANAPQGQSAPADEKKAEGQKEKCDDCK
ncbi:hypothetical protein ASPWEDRAFT_25523 [Aspergillus wentii DTO 134E9]|uniref:Selenoprotein W-like protein n=1 Tax=Aspergillus wentii DTO 134E9 TaxID=1073089 RepID=A0A1L9RXQ6_ASPWE|nr:uncharacterized protein ASPWEDRAFT_25523 [Aspergillus wentii DTO 134E9]OJJ39716.1 hypothetical protein ASPWEDRAFT_25523 [Aspergillus wentii DTO 134E9]